jgi:ComF family protein
VGLISNIVQSGKDLLFSERCQHCDKLLYGGEEILCLDCFIDLDFQSIYPDQYLYRLFSTDFPLQTTFSLLDFKKEEVVQTLLHNLKYKNQERIGSYLGRLSPAPLVKHLKTVSKIDLIVPIPLHKSRRNERGYNQVNKWAKSLANKCGIDYSEKVLRRTKKTNTQAKQTKSGRVENMEGAFKIKLPAESTVEHILILDDIITTGSTIREAAKTCINAGAKSLSIGCIASRASN